MRQSLLKDKKWLRLVTASIFLAIIAIFLAFKENDYVWMGPAIFSIWMMVLAVRRVKELKLQ